MLLVARQLENSDLVCQLLGVMQGTLIHFPTRSNAFLMLVSDTFGEKPIASPLKAPAAVEYSPIIQNSHVPTKFSQ